VYQAEPLEEVQGGRGAAAPRTDAIARTLLYRDSRLALENFAVTEISELLEQPDIYLWVDMCAPQTHDLGVIAAELGLHELAIADAVGVRQQPKLDRYASHEFLNMYAARLDPQAYQVKRQQSGMGITPSRLAGNCPSFD
jgi:magnesium transporter